jgi:hypothetical protein
MRLDIPPASSTVAPVCEWAHDFGRHAAIVQDFEHGRSCTSSFTQVDSLLPKSNITKHRLKRIEAVHLVRKQRDERRQEIAFSARPSVLRGLPLRRLRSAASRLPTAIGAQSTARPRRRWAIPGTTTPASPLLAQLLHIGSMLHLVGSRSLRCAIAQI